MLTLAPTMHSFCFIVFCYAPCYDNEIPQVTTIISARMNKMFVYLFKRNHKLRINSDSTWESVDRPKTRQTKEMFFHVTSLSICVIQGVHVLMLFSLQTHMKHFAIFYTQPTKMHN